MQPEPRFLFASAAHHLPRTQALSGVAQREGFDIVLERGGEAVTGQVRDSTGGSIAGALVVTTARSGGRALDISAGDGTFALYVPPGEQRLVVSADGYSRATRNVWAPSSGIELTLTPASSIEGRVVRAGTETPVAAVLVHAVNSDGLREAPREVLSDAEGRFSLASLAAGEYRLTAVAAGWRSEESVVRVGVAEPAGPVLLGVALAHTLTGHVFVGDTPCARGWLHAEGPTSESSEIRSGGKVELSGLWPGPYSLRIQCAGALSILDELLVESESLSRTWNLDAGLTLHGFVLDTQGSPVPTAQVRVDSVTSREQSANSQCSTDEAGAFACSGLEPGEYDCWVEQATGMPLGAAARVRVADADPSPLTLHVPSTGTIRVHVDPNDGGDLGSLVVVARRAGQSPIRAKLSESGFAFEDVEPGEYRVSVEPDAQSSARVILERAGQVLDVQLPSQRRVTLSGLVLGEGGVPVIDAWVQASVSDPELVLPPMARSTVMTNDRGEFSLPGLVRGRYDLDVSASPGRTRVASVDTAAGPITVYLESEAALTVRVTDSKGEPVGVFSLGYRREDGTSETVHVRGSDGLWTFAGIAPGRYTLLATSERGVASTALKVSPGAALSVDLPLSAEPVHAQLDGAEQPLTLDVAEGRTD